MPYSIDEKDKLPAHVQKLSAQRMKQWIEVWNSSYKACSEKEDSDERKCEVSAFRKANGVVSKAMERDQKEIELDTMLLFGLDEFEAKVGARNSKLDYKRIQMVHDVACELGAKCEQMNNDDGEPMMDDAKGVNLTKHISRVQRAWETHCRMKRMASAGDLWFGDEVVRGAPYPREVMDDQIIVGFGEKLWAVPYEMEGDEIEFGDPVRVEIVYQPVSEGEVKADLENTLVNFGANVKALADGRVGGYLVLFSGPNDPDVSSMRDYFTKETDYGTHTLTDVYYSHGLDKALGKRRLGKNQGQLKVDDVGVWVETQLDLADKYEKAIHAMAKQGKLGWSSGTASHLVERQKVGQSHWIKYWPLGLDASLTPAPAEGRTKETIITSLKSYLDEVTGLKIKAWDDRDEAGASYEEGIKLVRAKAEAELLLLLIDTIGAV